MQEPFETRVFLSLCRPVTYLGVPPQVAALEFAVALGLTNVSGGSIRGFLVAASTTVLLHALAAAATRHDYVLLFTVARSLIQAEFYEALPLGASTAPRPRPALSRPRLL